MEDNTNPEEQEPVAVVAPTKVSDLQPKMKLTGTVKRLELYGAFIDIGVGTNALIHISKLGTEHVNRVSDVINVDDEVTVWVEKVNPERDQVMLSMIEPLAVEWRDLEKGQEYTGTVTRLENYGAFVNVGAEREGLVHISEISHDYVKHPNEVLTVGDEVQVQVLGYSKRKRRIDLSIKNLLEKPEQQEAQQYVEDVREYEEYIEEEEIGEVPTAMEIALRRAMGDESIDSIGHRPRRKKRRGTRYRRKSRRAQEDLLDRTLQMSD